MSVNQSDKKVQPLNPLLNPSEPQPRIIDVMLLQDLPAGTVWYKKDSWWQRFWYTADLLANVTFSWPLSKITGLRNAFGWTGETMSSVFGKNLGDSCKFCNWMCKFLGHFNFNHCQKAINPFVGLSAPKWWWINWYR